MSRKKLAEETNTARGARLLEAIKALGLRQNSFANSIKVSAPHVSDMCKGKRAIQDHHLLLIEKVHSINPDYIRGISEKIFLEQNERDRHTNGDLKPSGEKIETIKVFQTLIEELRSDKKSLNETIKKLFQELEIKNKQIEDLKKEVVALAGKQTPAIQ